MYVSNAGANPRGASFRCPLASGLTHPQALEKPLYPCLIKAILTYFPWEKKTSFITLTPRTSNFVDNLEFNRVLEGDLARVRPEIGAARLEKISQNLKNDQITVFKHRFPTGRQHTLDLICISGTKLSNCAVVPYNKSNKATKNIKRVILIQIFSTKKV